MMINLIKFLSKNIEKKLILYLGLTIVFIIVASICTANIPLILKKIIDQLSINNFNAIFTLVILYLSLLLLEKFFNEIQFLSYPNWENGVIKSAYIGIFESLFNSKPGFFKNKLYGAISSQICQGISGLDSLMFDLVFKTLPLIINFVFIIATIIFTLNITVALIISIGAIIYTTIMYILNSKLIKHQINLRNSTIHTQGMTNDLIFSWKDIKLTNSQNYMKEIISDNVNKILKKSKKFYYKRGMYGFIQSSIVCIVIGIANYYEITRYLNGLSTIGSIVLVNNYLLIIMRPLEAFSLILRGVSKSYSDFTSVFEILNSGKESFEYQNKLLSINSIHLSNINVDKIINSISLDIQKGEKIAIIGESGAGKSTLFNIMTGLKTDFTGKVYINEDKDNLIDPNILKNHIAYCCSDARLIKANLTNNISLGKNINVNDYLKIASLDDKIKQLDNGLDTIISESCSIFSAGEMQRVKIARTAALGRDFEFYDESTSSFDDNLTEKILNNLLSRKDKSVVFITHNTKFLKLFDTVYSLTNGSLLKICLEN